MAVAFKPAFTTNPMTSDFILSIPPDWVVMFLDSHLTVLTFRSWLDLLGNVLAFWISILKIFKSLQNILHRVTDIRSSEIHLESSSGHTLSFYPIWWNIVSFQEYDSVQNRENTEGFSNCIVWKNTDKFGKRIGLNKQSICKSQMGRDQVSGGVSVPCRHATPVANVLRKPLIIQ